MKLDHKSAWMILPILMVVVFQNCGQFTPTTSLELSSSSEETTEPGGLPTGLSQSAFVFRRDPTTASGNAALPFTGDLSGLVTRVRMSHMLSETFLTNPYFEISTDTAYPDTFALPTASLLFAPSDSRFQQVNAYYHLDRLINDLVRRSVFPANYPVLTVDAHCTDENARSNAYYSFDDHTLCMGYADVNAKRIWAADDGDVLVHEFGHSLNHQFASTEILTSTSDMGALDEGFADLWAYQQNRGEKIAPWFGRAIFAAGGINVNPYPGLRNLAAVKQYPAAAVYELHDDSVFLSGAMTELIKRSAMSFDNEVLFKKRILESLQIGFGVGDVIHVLKDEAQALGISSATVTSVLSARGLYRTDAVSEISLVSTKNVYVLDNHAFDGYQVGGNCNSALDAGETAILFPNLQNTGVLKGGVRVRLQTTTVGISILAGGDFGYLHRMPANQTFVAGELAGLAKNNGDYLAKLIGASFLVRVASGTTGNAHFRMTIESIDTIGSANQTKVVEFDMPIGAVANMTTTCPGSGETGVYP